MNIQRNFLAKIRSEFILIGILCLIGLIPRPKPLMKKGNPYYSSTVMVRCFIVRVWLRIPSNNALHEYFSIDMQYNTRVMKSHGLDRLSNRRTFYRRFKTISIDIRSRIDAVGILFIKDGLVDPIVSVGSSLLKAKGHVWLRSNTKNEVPRSGIDRYRGKTGLQQNQGMGIRIQTAYSLQYRYVDSSIIS